ncbi:insulinase family protein [Mesoflavibacter profundi]|uniref:Insulinase family protein n=1 Tax=Mesoflavibacter profundi TaxID=2708110 RepID=A0ABT4S033_9FLAO|nr:insulinase family protein [Mesoflavibacter profundi]MDA0177100.1 insulinase family protein [Mesoflavibacter profundi]
MKKSLSILTLVLFVLTGTFKLNGQTVTKTSHKTNQTSTFNSAEKIPFNPEVTKGVLSNGLTYYIKNNGKPENKVELRLVVKAGSILEDQDQLGLAHFMEHMNFNGTKNFKKNELVDYLQSIGVKFGAHLNAYTSFDETVYMLPIPSDDPEKLEKGFQILEDWAHNALLTEKDIDEERGVVLEEYRLGQGADERMMQNYLPKVMYGSKYAERLPIGTKDNLENFTYESLRRYYKDWYRPDLMAVIAVGDIDVATLEAKIKSHFGKIPKATNPRNRDIYYVPNHDETFIAIEKDKEAPFSQVRVLFKDKDNSKEDTTLEEFRHSITESLFSQMLNNRLDELRNSENPPFVYGYSFHGGTWADTKDAYQSFAMTSPDGQLKALKTLLEENERVRKFGFGEAEFNRAKKDILARFEKSFKDKDKTESNRLLGEYIRNFLVNEPMPGIEWEFNFYKAQLPTITLEEVNQLISSYIKDTNRVIVLTGPDKEDLKTVTEQEVLDLLASVKNTDLKPYEDKEVASSLITTLLPEGTIVKEETNTTLNTTTLTLSNGATVTYKKTDFKNDEILFDGFSFGGTSLYSDQDYKATVFANNGLTEAGVNGFDKVELGKMLSGKIVNVRPRLSGLTESISGSCSPKDLEELFQLTYLYFTALNKDQSAFNSYINKQKAFIGNMLASPQFYFQDQYSQFVYGANPRYTGFPNTEKLENADYDLAYKKYQERFANAGDFHFYFVGNIDDQKLKSFAKKYLANLPSTNTKEDYKTFNFRPLSGSHTKIVEKGTDPKSSVRIVYQGETDYNQKDEYYLNSLAEILTIKLIEKLREEEGGVYGVGARGNLNKIPYGWYNFTISFPCGPENVDKLKDAAIAEVEQIIKNGPTDEDLAKIKEAQLLERKEDLKENRFWLNTLKNADYEGHDVNKLLEFETSVNNLTKVDIQKTAKKFLTKGYILGIHNPEKQ